MQQFLPGYGRIEVFVFLRHCRWAMETKLCMFDIYNDIMGTAVVPHSWYWTKLVPIVKLGKDSMFGACLLMAGSLWKK
jgi:hypothetical protein